MDKILLGMLLFRRSTIYEIRDFIHNHMRTMCSDSMGSIQAGIKKLLSQNYIGFDEIIDNNVKKKIYYTTEAGKDEFSKWIDHPMDATKSKNIDFSKFFFMGLIPLQRRIELLEKSIENLKTEKTFLENIKSFSTEEKQAQIEHSSERINNDPLTKSNLENISQTNDIAKIVEDSIEYQFLGLEFAISKNKFEIDWYTKLVKKLKKEGIKNNIEPCIK